MKEIDVWLERIASVRRSLLKKTATEYGLQLVHIEILQYLSACNKYSDTASALMRYLGQTKGTISQSLIILEKKHLIKKNQDDVDKRIFHLAPTNKGKKVCERLLKKLNVQSKNNPPHIAALETMLHQLQVKNDLKGFGICRTCRFNRTMNETSFLCELTNEILSIDQSSKICNEHEV